MFRPSQQQGLVKASTPAEDESPKDFHEHIIAENDYLTRGRTILHISILLGLVVISLYITAQREIYKHKMETSTDKTDKDVYNIYNSCMYVAWATVAVFGVYALYSAITYIFY